MAKHKSKHRKVKVELIPVDSPEYEMMYKIRKKYHDGIRKAKIGLMWLLKVKSDSDGHLLLGKCKKASDFQRELSEFDFVILLNKEMWEHPKFGHKRQKALLDHELCHASAVYDDEGHRVKTIRGKYVFRTRKHDIEEFREIVERHGCYKRDLEEFAESLKKGRKHRV